MTRESIHPLCCLDENLFVTYKYVLELNNDKKVKFTKMHDFYFVQLYQHTAANQKLEDGKSVAFSRQNELLGADGARVRYMGHGIK